MEITDAHLVVDVVLFAPLDGVLHVALVERAHAPFRGRLAITGGYVEHGETVNADGVVVADAATGETVEDAGLRELKEEAGVGAETLSREDIVLVGAYTAPGRDPRARVVSVAYAALLPVAVPLVAGSDARQARWVPVPEARVSALAFDHNVILDDSVDKLRPLLPVGLAV